MDVRMRSPGITRRGVRSMALREGCPAVRNPFAGLSEPTGMMLLERKMWSAVRFGDPTIGITL